MPAPRRSVTVALVAATLTALALPAPTNAIELTRAEVIARAVERSYDIEAAVRRKEMTDARIDASRALLASNPFVSFSYWDSTDQTLLGDGRTEGIGPSYTVSVSQTFEIAGQRGKRIEIAHHNDAVASANVDASRQSLITRVERAFNEALEAHARVQLAFEELHWQRERHKAYRSASEAARNESQIRISRSESQYNSEKHALFLQESRLRQMLQIDGDEPLVLVGDFPDEIVPVPAEADLVAYALANRADLAAHRAAAASDEAFVSLTRRSAVPNVTLSGFLSHSDEDDFGDEFQFGGSVSVPLPVFRTAGPTIDEAIAERARSQAELADIERGVVRDVREARYACLAAAADVDRVRNDVLPLARANVALQDEAFDAGEVGIWELVGAEIDLVEARREELAALRIYANALVELERALGAPLDGIGAETNGDAEADGSPAAAAVDGTHTFDPNTESGAGPSGQSPEE